MFFLLENFYLFFQIVTIDYKLAQFPNVLDRPEMVSQENKLQVF